MNFRAIRPGFVSSEGRLSCRPLRTLALLSVLGCLTSPRIYSVCTSSEAGFMYTSDWERYALVSSYDNAMMDERMVRGITFDE